VARQARSVTLNGTVEGLSPEGALAAVLATTSLEPALAGDRIRIASKKEGTVPGGDSPVRGDSPL
jgi:hypothetical protein